MLRDLLDSLARQQAGSLPFELVVVDNDAAASARATAEAFRDRGPWVRFVYGVEPHAGLSHARNRAVGLCRGDWIAFIDDDEVASDNWLAALMAQAQQSHADVVLGPVLSVFPLGSTRWAARSGCFERPRHRSGTLVSSDEGRTGNALVHSKWLAAADPFDPRYAFTGGEDYAFFKRIAAAGAVLVWCDEAVVSEIVPLQRQRLRWVLARALRGSMNYWRINGTRDSAVHKACRAAYGVAGGTLFAVLGALALPFGVHRALPYWSKAAKGLGRLAALGTSDLEAYRHV